MARIVFYSVVLASVLATAGVASAQCPGCKTWNRPLTEESQPDVFYNFYVPGNGGSPAAALPAPYPTPPIVGHSYYTYQPLIRVVQKLPRNRVGHGAGIEAPRRDFLLPERRVLKHVRLRFFVSGRFQVLQPGHCVRATPAVTSTEARTTE